MRLSLSRLTPISVALLAAVAVPRAGQSAQSGAVEGTVSIKKDGATKSDRSGVVVYLEGVPGGAANALPANPKVRQKGLAFAPALTVVTTGTSVEFPNEDKVYHNVFSVSNPAKFDLGLYRSGESKSVQFKRPGVVDVYCNIHPDMQAKVMVVDTRHYAVTDGNGKFRIDGVPPGTYSIVAWQRHGDPYRGKVTVSSGGTAKLDVALVEGAPPKRHLRKDGTPYGRYE